MLSDRAYQMVSLCLLFQKAFSSLLAWNEDVELNTQIAGQRNFPAEGGIWDGTHSP